MAKRSVVCDIVGQSGNIDFAEVTRMCKGYHLDLRTWERFGAEKITDKGRGCDLYNWGLECTYVNWEAITDRYEGTGIDHEEWPVPHVRYLLCTGGPHFEIRMYDTGKITCFYQCWGGMCEVDVSHLEGYRWLSETVEELGIRPSA